jgi:hypothetical protein
VLAKTSTVDALTTTSTSIANATALIVNHRQRNGGGAAFADSATVATIPDKFGVATLPNAVIGCSDGSVATVGIEDLALRVIEVGGWKNFIGRY